MAQETTQGGTSEDEIRMLEQKLEARKRELAGKTSEQPEEKEAFREVLRGHIEEAGRVPSEKPATGGVPSATHRLTDDLKKKTDELKKEEAREEQVRKLVEIALTRSIRDAVKIARDATPYLLDELHDHLVDDYYDKLIQLRKIKEL